MIAHYFVKLLALNERRATQGSWFKSFIDDILGTIMLMIACILNLEQMGVGLNFHIVFLP